MKTMPWYRVPEVWLMIILVGSVVAAGITTLVIAERLPDAHIVHPDTQDFGNVHHAHPLVGRSHPRIARAARKQPSGG